MGSAVLSGVRGSPLISRKDTQCLVQAVHQLHAAAQADAARSAAIARDSYNHEPKNGTSKRPSARAMISADPELRKLGLKVLRREVVATWQYYAPMWVQRLVEWAASWVEAPATALWNYAFESPRPKPAAPASKSSAMALTAAPRVRAKED